MTFWHNFCSNKGGEMFIKYENAKTPRKCTILKNIIWGYRLFSDK